MSLISLLDNLADSIGLNGQEFRFAICLLSCFPLSIFHRILPTYEGKNYHKHIFSLISGLLISYLCFGWDLLHFVASTFITYLIMILVPKRCGWIAFVYNMIHLTWGNYDRLVNDYLGYSLNWTVPQMILCCKLCSVAWNYDDGQLDSKKKEKLTEYQKSHMIEETPSILEVFSYAFFFCGFLTGPWSDYNDYIEFTNRKMFKSENGIIPNSFLFILKRFAMISVALFGFILSDKYPVTMTLTEEWMIFPFWKRLALQMFAVELFYCKYYVVWWLGESTCSLIGISFNGRDEKGRAKWDRIKMVNIVKFKLARNIVRDMVPNWNMMSQHWLNKYVHQRFLRLGVNKGQSRWLTFVVSAIWHGLYPGYYVFFVQCALFMEVSTMLSELVWPLISEKDGKIVKYPLLVNIGTPILTLLCLDYLAINFQLMSFWRGVKATKSLYFVGHVIMLAIVTLYFTTDRKSVV